MPPPPGPTGADTAPGPAATTPGLGTTPGMTPPAASGPPGAGDAVLWALATLPLALALVDVVLVRGFDLEPVMGMHVARGASAALVIADWQAGEPLEAGHTVAYEAEHGGEVATVVVTVESDRGELAFELRP